MRVVIIQILSLGNKTNSVIIPGSICSFTCNPGYQLIGPDRLLCLSTSQWSQLPPRCQQIVRCNPLAPVANALMIGSCFGELLIPLNTCSISCNPGYLLVGQSLLTCTTDGTWSSSLPSCIPVTCPPLTFAGPDRPLASCVNPQGSQSSDSNIVSGSTCRISCPYCTILNGPSSISCLPSGQWDGSVGTCSPINCPDITNMATPDFITSQGNCNNARCDDICTFRCTPGYEIQGSSSLTCGPNGQWNQPIPRCIQSKCPDWSVPTGGLFINECPEGLNCPSLCPGIPNQRCKLRCGAGYRLVGTTEEVICTPSTLQWSQALPTCEPIR
uniref:Sushi domain-containing protein n=1 Tax=Tetranychus urticae TaxID=32264 RepID=T1KJU6_TETUR